MLRTVMVSRFSISRRRNKEDAAELHKPSRKSYFFRRNNNRQHPHVVTTKAEPATTQTQQQTRVVPMTLSPQTPPPPRDLPMEPTLSPEVIETTTMTKPPRFFHCGTLCGAGRQAHRMMEEEATMTTEWRGPTLSEDPSVQESIECIVAATQGDLVDLLKRSDDDYLPTPSGLQQSLLKNRSFRREPPQYPQRRRYNNNNDPPLLATTAAEESTEAAATACEEEKISSSTPPPCGCCAGRPPTVLPEDWPQRPLLLRPTPDSGTVVKGVRFVDSTDYLWQPGDDDATTWPQALARHWGNYLDSNNNESTHCCEQCVILPLNNGQEPDGETLVTDFESPLFEGTLIVRIRDCHGTTDEATQQEEGYFHGLNRRYQVVVRGKFKTTVPLTECMTGFQYVSLVPSPDALALTHHILHSLDRPAGKLPAKWMVNGVLNVVRFFAPQLQTCIDGDRPYSLSPLGSTPQALVVGDTSTNLAASQQEPTQAQHTLLGQASDAQTSLQRAKLRKKQFDKLFANQSSTPVTNSDATYTFEFLQHLFHFHDFCIELGSLLGSIPLAPLLDGQAMQIMACTGADRQKIWSFDVWHECLLDDAQRHFAASQ